MNEPIISPWLFYWASTVNGIIAFCAFGAAISLGAAKQNKKNSKKCFIAAAIFMVALIFVPSETTIYRMVAASYATPQNIEYVAEKTGKAIDSSVDYIVDKIIEAGSKWEQRNNGNNN